MSETFLDGRVTLHAGDSRDVLKTLADNSIDSIVTDPPYALVSIVKRFGKPGAAPAKGNEAYQRASAGFMGKQWDTGETAFATEFWAECLRVLKPGGHVVAFSGTRTYHRMACAIEDAGFEVRDMLSWLYGSGFPKSHDVSKGMDKSAGREREVIRERYTVKRIKPGATVEREGAWGKQDIAYTATDTAPASPESAEWQGWGTALKPACEPICFGRKPLTGTVAANVLEHGTGAINIDGCRVGTDESLARPYGGENEVYGKFSMDRGTVTGAGLTGRWPANIIHDGSEEVIAAFPESDGGAWPAKGIGFGYAGGERKQNGVRTETNDGGSAARFFYQVKQDEICPSTKFARSAEKSFDLKSDLVVSVLSHAVEASTLGLVLQSQSYRAPSTNVTASVFAEIETLVIATIQNLERRFSLGLPLGRFTLKGSRADIVVVERPTDTIRIIISLSKSFGSAGRVTFNIIAKSAEVGASGSVNRLFYTAKADADDRLGSKHPTVKPVDLMQWLCRLVTPKGGTVLDPFAGTGTTGEAAFREGFKAVLIEREEEYQADIRRRMALCMAGPDERKRESIKAKVGDLPFEPGSLFA